MVPKKISRHAQLVANFIESAETRDPAIEQEIKDLSRYFSDKDDAELRLYRQDRMIELRKEQIERWTIIIEDGTKLSIRLDDAENPVEARKMRQKIAEYEARLPLGEEDLKNRQDVRGKHLP